MMPLTYHSSNLPLIALETMRLLVLIKSSTEYNFDSGIARGKGRVATQFSMCLGRT